MNSFIKKLKDLTKKEETYASSEIEVRVKEDPNSEYGRDVFIYLREQISDSNLYKYPTARIKATNMEDIQDFIEYRLHALPGGRAGFGGYLYPKDLDKSRMSFYSFSDFWYKTFGEEISSERKFTIDELKGFLQIFRSRIEDAKYQCLYEVKYKDSFEGIRKFKGSRYFGGILQGDTRQFEQIEGENDIELGEFLSTYTQEELLGDELQQLILEALPEKMKDDMIKKLTVSDVNIRIGEETINLARCYNHRGIKNNNVTPFELIDLCSVKKTSRIYDSSYFTKDALSKIVEKREKERGI
ncbi:MAG: hypothetical protein IJB90_04645 [Clostridia bacterium]|nr:hypothetical protein [Clostridia bacterium]